MNRVDGVSTGVLARLFRFVRHRKFTLIIVGVFILAYGIPVAIHHVDSWVARMSLPGVLPDLRSDLTPTRVDIMGESFTSNDSVVDQRIDSRPLRTEEIFRDEARNVNYENISLKLQGLGVTNDCVSAVWGASVSGAVKSGGCSQVIRGLYVNEARSLVGFIGVLNMRDASAAKQVVTLFGQRSSDGFIYSLRSEDFGEFGPGYSLASTRSVAHYVFISWAQRADRSEPPTGDNELIHALVALEGAAGVLNQRAGQPED